MMLQIGLRMQQPLLKKRYAVKKMTPRVVTLSLLNPPFTYRTSTLKRVKPVLIAL